MDAQQDVAIDRGAYRLVGGLGRPLMQLSPAGAIEKTHGVCVPRDNTIGIGGDKMRGIRVQRSRHGAGCVGLPVDSGEGDVVAVRLRDRGEQLVTSPSSARPINVQGIVLEYLAYDGRRLAALMANNG